MLLFLLRVELASAITIQFKIEIHSLVPRACWLFNFKEVAFLIRKPRDLGNNVAKYQQTDCTHVDGIAE